MPQQTTVTNSLRGQFRYLILALWIAACAVFGWVGLTDQNIGARILLGVISVLASGFMLFVAKEESALVSNHVLANGEVLSYFRRRGRGGGITVKYRFTAIDGQSYQASSSIYSSQSLQTGQRIPVLYNPLLPTESKPLAGFIFYRFDVPEVFS
jgi:hypothetical protein